MLEARMQSPRGSLYFAAEATPYDLEMLQLYVHDLTMGARRRDLRLEVSVDEHDPAAAVIASWLGELAASGVRVSRARGALSR
jgi:hypothetical protein